MARKDRHSLFGGRMGFGSLFVERGSQEHRQTKTSWKSFGPREAKCDQYFFLNPLGEDRRPDGTTRLCGKNRKGTDSFVKGLILAQNERWRRGLGMQVERAW